MGSFADGVKRFRVNATADVARKHDKVVFELFRRVILKTPVDTGRARMNWFVNVGPEPEGQTTEDTDKPGSIAIGRVRNSLGEFKAGQVIWLSNNLPYITKLEYGGYNEGEKTSGGYSLQAPQGMVRVTALEFGQIVSEHK